MSNEHTPGPTPRTDAQTHECREYYDDGGFRVAGRERHTDGTCVDVEFTRALERELTQAQARAEQLKNERQGAMHSSESWELLHAKHFEEMEVLRARVAELEAKEAASSFAIKHNHQIACDLRTERDALKATLAVAVKTLEEIKKTAHPFVKNSAVHEVIYGDATDALAHIRGATQGKERPWRCSKAGQAHPEAGGSIQV